jgi:hypothetical protein
MGGFERLWLARQPCPGLELDTAALTLMRRYIALRSGRCEPLSPRDALRNADDGRD